EITVYGPSHGLHSGHYGNWAPNPVTLLANLIASMRDDDGKILIKSFYDDVAPVTAAERAAASSAPPVDSALRDEVQLAATASAPRHRTPFRPRPRRRSTFGSCRARRRSTCARWSRRTSARGVISSSTTTRRAPSGWRTRA